jgi:hypothetical protein
MCGVTGHQREEPEPEPETPPAPALPVHGIHQRLKSVVSRLFTAPAFMAFRKHAC